MANPKRIKLALECVGCGEYTYIDGAIGTTHPPHTVPCVICDEDLDVPSLRVISPRTTQEEPTS